MYHTCSHLADFAPPPGKQGAVGTESQAKGEVKGRQSDVACVNRDNTRVNEGLNEKHALDTQTARNLAPTCGPRRLRFAPRGAPGEP